MKTTELVTFNRSVVVSPREASRLPQVLDTPMVQLVPVDNIAKVALRPGAWRAGSVAREDADANRQADRVGKLGLTLGRDDLEAAFHHHAHDLNAHLPQKRCTRSRLMARRCTATLITTLGEDASRIRAKPGVMARIYSVALEILRANGVQNISLALHANAGSFDRLFALGIQ